MAYSEQDKVFVAHFLGYGRTWTQADPRLENALLATQSVADGGSRPDSSTENYIKGLVYGTAAVSGTLPVPGPMTQNTTFAMPATLGLLQIEQQLATMWGFTYALEADRQAKVDTARGAAQLRAEGRRLAYGLAKMLGMKGPRANIFSSKRGYDDNDPFAYTNSPFWP